METPQSPTREGAKQRCDENPALQVNRLEQVRSHANSWQAWQPVRPLIEQDLTLKLNLDKSQGVNSRQCQFLGCSVHDKHIRWHRKSVDKFKRRVRELTRRSGGVPMASNIRALSLYWRGLYWRGWSNDYGMGNPYQHWVELDHWIRRRVTMGYWKQWGKARTERRNLLKLGLPLKAAVAGGRSSKGGWHSAKSDGIKAALGPTYLKQQGLFSFRDGSIACHHG